MSAARCSCTISRIPLRSTERTGAGRSASSADADRAERAPGTGGKVSDCVLRVVFRMRDKNDNSGVFIRIPLEPREEWMPVHYGYEVQIDNEPEKSNEDDYHYTAGLYSLTKPLVKAGKPGPEWNTMEITLQGPRTVIYLNGQKVTDYTEGQPVPERKFDFEPQHGRRPDAGWFGLQNHSKNDVVFFKEVAMKSLKK